MTSPAKTDYNTSDFKGHVDIGGYKLHAQITGPPRKDDQPLIILIHGTAGLLEQFAALVRALKDQHRVLVYSRAGLGYSEPRPSTPSSDPSPPTLESISQELNLLLNAMGQQPPYALISHSWGGMIATHCISTLASRPLPARGLVILDGGCPTRTDPPASHYTSFANDPGTPWGHPCVQKLLQALDTFTLQSPRDKVELTSAEYDALVTAKSRTEHGAGAALEFAGLFGSYVPFAQAAYFQPGNVPKTPICIVHAHAYESFRNMIAEGVKRGNGTAEERAEAAKLLETWQQDVLVNQKQFLDLTEEKMGKALMTKSGTAHDVFMQDVASAVGGLEWVLGAAAEQY